MIELVPLSNLSATTVESLLDRAFGTDRHLRTAYRVRSGMAVIAELSFAALLADGTAVGTIQAWPILFTADDGATRPLVMVGPVAVEPDWQREGIGRSLTAHMLRAADRSSYPGADALILIGDPEYYGRFFGFSADHTGGWRLPGPFEPHRLLARGPAVPSGAGQLGPRVPATV